MSDLPIEPLRPALLESFARGPVVVSSPTGSGKSTQVPRWLADHGRVLVVEPRRVACRALAHRVAELEGSPVGERVGYAVRDDRRASRSTRILFVTPGVALRRLASGDRDDALVLDEFHERSLDLDLLLALALRRRRRGLVVMSATLDGDRIADHVGGVHLRGEGRLHPVDVRYLGDGADGPTDRELVDRVRAGLAAADDAPGDVLVFLPGKREIGLVGAALRGPGREIVELHGGLSSRAQAEALKPRRGGNRGRRIYVATNVAETSLTLPGIGLVVDTGLVRRTAYHGGRGYLALLPIAQDAADQRAGRAGRLGPGVAVRLWRRSYKLAASTPPEVQRESLVPLVLGALAAGVPLDDVGALPVPDPLAPYAVEAAVARLTELGALDGAALTPRGRRMFQLPVDADLGRLMVEGEARGIADDVVDLCASLSTRRRLFAGRPDDPEDDLRAGGCDALGGIRAVRIGDPERNALDRAALADARRAADRFRGLLGLPPRSGDDPPVDRRALALALLAAWPGCAHVARRRKRATAWAAGGTELTLGRDVAVDEESVEAILVLGSRAFSTGATRRRLAVTAAMPVPTTWLVAADLGDWRLGGTSLERGRLVGRLERVYAGRVLETREETPRGALAREAVRDLFVRGSLFRGAAAEAARRLETLALAAQLEGRPAPPPLPEWVLLTLETLGLTDGADLALLDRADLLPDPPSPDLLERIERDFPRELSTGDAVYRIDYAVARREATLVQIKGTRRTPPPDLFLPRLPGWRLRWTLKNRTRVIRER